MKITLCIDKQARTTPSAELKQYQIDIGCPLRSYGEIFDELKISSDEETGFLIGSITRRCYVDKFGVLKKLEQEEIQKLEIPAIELFEGTNYVYILEYTNLNMRIEYLTNAEMNKYFATRVEMHTTIQQTYDSIMLSVSKKVDGNEIIAAINMSPEEIMIQANRLGLTANDVLNILSGNEINMKTKQLKIVSDNFNVDENGNCTANSFSSNNANITGGTLSLSGTYRQSKITLTSSDENHQTTIAPGEYVINRGESNRFSILGYGSKDWLLEMRSDSNESISLAVGPTLGTSINVGNNATNQYTNIYSSGIFTPVLTETSQLEKKKNIEQFENALDLVLNSDIYKYNLKSENDDDKKHIGLIIGEGYRCCDEVISQNREGIEQYSMIAVLWQAFKEQQKQIETLKKELEAK